VAQTQNTRLNHDTAQSLQTAGYMKEMGFITVIAKEMSSLGSWLVSGNLVSPCTLIRKNASKLPINLAVIGP